MKHLFSILSLLSLVLTVNAQNTLHLTVRYRNTNAPIKNATIFLSANKKLLQTLTTNQFGETETIVAVGKYATLIVAMGMDSIKNNNIEVTHKSTRVVLLMDAQKYIPVSINTPKPIYEKDIKKIGLKKLESVKFKRGVYSSKGKSGIAVLGARAETKTYVVDGVDISSKEKKASIKPEVLETKFVSTDDAKYAAPMMEMDVVSSAATTSFAPIATKAGTLTTGEVNDFTKWHLYEEVTRDELSKYLESWQFYMDRRYCVQAINQYGKPVVNAKAQLLQDGKIIWQGQTDNTGKAELWAGIHEKEFNKPCTIQLSYGGEVYNYLQPILFEDGINYFQLAVPCSYSNDVDIAFIVDATGSMGDEIQYLKSELNDILGRAQSVNKNLKFNTASVFYQDMTDAYVTIKSDFSADIATTKSFIDTKFAGGGGDFPEAVDEALTVAVHELNWRENARTKILFLVLDAPPHADAATQKRFYEVVEAAAEKGIRIIPVTASGINKNVEYIMRSVALATNGTYTFLTNHSGVGGAHIEPSTDSYKVEKMNDLLIRLITQFTYIPECEADNMPIAVKSDSIAIEKINNENPFSEWNVTSRINIYPNPNEGQFFVEIPKGCTELLITDIAGKVMKRIICADNTKVEVDITSFPSGVYFVRVLDKDKWLSGKVVKG